MQISEGRAIPVEEIASAKALRQERGCLECLRNSSGARVNVGKSGRK